MFKWFWTIFSLGVPDEIDRESRICPSRPAGCVFKTCTGRLNYVPQRNCWILTLHLFHESLLLKYFSSVPLWDGPVSNAWLQPVDEIALGRVYRLNFDCFQVLFSDSKEFYLEKTKGKLTSRHPFSKVCFQSSILDTFFLSLKENLTGS